MCPYKTAVVKILLKIFLLRFLVRYNEASTQGQPAWEADLLRESSIFGLRWHSQKQKPDDYLNSTDHWEKLFSFPSFFSLYHYFALTLSFILTHLPPSVSMSTIWFPHSSIPHPLHLSFVFTFPLRHLIFTQDIILWSCKSAALNQQGFRSDIPTPFMYNCWKSMWTPNDDESHFLT